MSIQALTGNTVVGSVVSASAAKPDLVEEEEVEIPELEEKLGNLPEEPRKAARTELDVWIPCTDCYSAVSHIGCGGRGIGS